MNIGKWVLSNLFDGFVVEEFRTIRRNHQYGSPFSAEQHLNEHESVATTSRSTVFTLVKTVSMVPAIVPDMSIVFSRRKSLSIGAPLIPLTSLRDPLPTIPQSPTNMATPTPRPRHTSETPSASKNASKDIDYFTLKTKRASGAPTTPDDFSGWGGPAAKGRENDATPLVTPSTPSSGGFMGRLRQLGKSSKRTGDETSSSAGDSASNRISASHERDSKVVRLIFCLHVV